MNNLNEILQNAYQKVKYEDGSPFTESAFEQLKKEISLYVFQLVDESYRFAKRAKNDLISEENVKNASSHLTKHANESKKILSSIGAFLFGLSLTKTIDILGSDSNFSTPITMIIISTGVIGAFLLGLNLFNRNR